MGAVTPGPREADRPDAGDDRILERAAAFGAIVVAHAGRLCNYVYRHVRSREVAEDIVQELFIRLWERGDAQQLQDPLPYLYQASHNRALSYLRQQRVRRRWETQAMTAPEGADGTAHGEMELSELASALEHAIAELPERRRQVFLMSRDEGLPHAEIARILGLSVKTVESHVWRAITTLRASVARHL